MSIRGVTSTLPDPKYVQALERELRELKEQMQILAGQIASRGGN